MAPSGTEDLPRPPGGTAGVSRIFWAAAGCFSVLAAGMSAWGQSPAAPVQAPPPGASQEKPDQAPPPPAAPAPDVPEEWSLHFQATVVIQGHGSFTSPYAGPNSLSGSPENATTDTATIFLGRRLWNGAALYADPEVAGGTGLSKTLGLGGETNGEAIRAASPSPKGYIARLYIEQSVDLGEDYEPVAAEANQLGGRQCRERLTVTLGKLSALDAFDDNTYSHDARGQFGNWSLQSNGAWDYPADARGYNYGGTIELFWKEWAFRYGLFAMPELANGFTYDHTLSHAHGQALEAEYDYSFFERPGKIRLMGYQNNGRMGDYREALRLAPASPDITQTREYRIKFGFTLNAEQKITDDLGAFLRAGWNDGRTETFAFTEIDRTAEAGAALAGTAWSRPDDTVAVAFVANGLSSYHRDYLAAGGLGFILGDGRLSYGWETILELYYRVRVAKSLFVTFDYQFIENPGYNRDRGPVSILGLRVHVEF